MSINPLIASDLAKLHMQDLARERRHLAQFDAAVGRARRARQARSSQRRSSLAPVWTALLGLVSH